MLPRSARVCGQNELDGNPGRRSQRAEQAVNRIGKGVLPRLFYPSVGDVTALIFLRVVRVFEIRERHPAAVRHLEPRRTIDELSPERNVNLLGAVDRILERYAGAPESDRVEA